MTQTEFNAAMASARNRENEKRNPSVELWHLNSALWSLISDPSSFVTGRWASHAKKRAKEKQSTNFFPQLDSILLCWFHLILTHKQSVWHTGDEGARPAWKMHVLTWAVTQLTKWSSLPLFVVFVLTICVLVFHHSHHTNFSKP